MRAPPRRPWSHALVALALSSAACQGQASFQDGVPDYSDPNPPPPPVQPNGTLPCNLDSVPATVTLPTVAADFARKVFDLLRNR